MDIGLLFFGVGVGMILSTVLVGLGVMIGDRNNQNNIIDLIINLFLSRIAEQKFHQLSFFIKELKSFPAINYLLELVLH